MLEGRGNELLACVHLLLGLFHNTVPWWGESSYAESRDEVVWLKAREVLVLDRPCVACNVRRGYAGPRPIPPSHLET